MPLLTPRVVYRPFEYEWAYDAYLKQNQAHWLPHEVPMSDDITDFRNKLTAEEKHLITQVLRFFTQGDLEVSSNYQTRLMPTFQVPEIAMMLAAFANIESVHVHAYSYLIDSLGLPETEYSVFLEYEAMRTKFDYLHGFKGDSLDELAKTLAVFGAFMEGTALFASFAILMNFPRQGKLRGLGQIIAWSMRDEFLHADNICRLYRTMIYENPNLNTDDHRESVREACRTMIRMEDRFIDLCFEQGAVTGISADEVKQYIRYIADRRLGNVNLAPMFGAVENPLPWLASLLSARDHVNFFENRATSYAKGTIDDSWPA